MLLSLSWSPSGNRDSLKALKGTAFGDMAGSSVFSKSPSGKSFAVIYVGY